LVLHGFPFSTLNQRFALSFDRFSVCGQGKIRSKARYIAAAVRRGRWLRAAVTVSGIKRSAAKLNVIGPQIRKLRQQKGWTQGQLAVKLQLFGWDTSQDSVSRLENGERRVPDLELFVLSNVLGADFGEFFPPNLRAKVKSLWPHYRAKLSRGQVPPVP
jgi:DNA-binding XRE family transcriptional regulator